MNKSYAVNRSVLAKANAILIDTYKELLDVTQFTDLSDLHSDRQYNGGAAACVVATRFGKGLFAEDNAHSALLKQETLSRAVAADRRLWLYNSQDFGWLHHDRLDEASRLIAGWFSSWRFSPESVRLPPGESFIANEGKVSIYQKLKGDWTVTKDAMLPFATLIAKTRYLRKTFYRKLQVECQKRKVNYDELVKAAYKHSLNMLKSAIIRGCHIEGLGRVTESNLPKLLRTLMVIKLCPFVLIEVRGSRLSSVPKDTKTRRPINVEPLGNVMLQLGVGSQLKNFISVMADNDLYVGQSHHRKLCKDLRYATIDFSGASDSISLGLLRQLFCRVPKLLNFLLRIRSKEVRITSDAGHHEWLELNKLSSMGNGFTFEVLTTVLLAIARTFDNTARVYGDDVIIRREYYDSFCSVCESVGFKVNRSKSFSDRAFRESCGTFYQEGFGEIVSFEFDAVCNIQRLFIAVNKLYILTETYRNSDFPVLCKVSQICASARSRLLSLFTWEPFQGPPVPPRRVLNEHGFETTAIVDNYIMDNGNVEWTNHTSRSEWKCIQEYAKLLGYGRRDVKLVRVLEEIKEFGSKTPNTSHNVFKIASYLYAGRKTPDTVRINPNRRSFRTQLYVSIKGCEPFRFTDTNLLLVDKSSTGR